MVLVRIKVLNILADREKVLTALFISKNICPMIRDGYWAFYYIFSDIFITEITLDDRCISLKLSENMIKCIHYSISKFEEKNNGR